MTLNSAGEITVFTGNALALPFPDNSVDLIISRPNYLAFDANKRGTNSSKDLDAVTSEKEILKNLAKVTKEAYRVLKTNGSLIVANEDYLNLDVKYLVQTLDYSNFNYYGKILHNGYDSNKVSLETYKKVSSSSVITWHQFVKGDQPFANPFKVKKYSNPVWDLPFGNENSEVDQWMLQDYPYVVDEINKEIPKRLIEMFSKKGHLVLDMFGGTGIVATTAASLGRHAISNDILEDMISATKLRIMLTFGEKYLNEKVKVVKDEKLNNKKLRVKR